MTPALLHNLDLFCFDEKLCELVGALFLFVFNQMLQNYFCFEDTSVFLAVCFSKSRILSIWTISSGFFYAFNGKF